MGRRLTEAKSRYLPHDPQGLQGVVPVAGEAREESQADGEGREAHAGGVGEDDSEESAPAGQADIIVASRWSVHGTSHRVLIPPYLSNAGGRGRTRPADRCPQRPSPAASDARSAVAFHSPKGRWTPRKSAESVGVAPVATGCRPGHFQLECVTRTAKRKNHSSVSRSALHGSPLISDWPCGPQPGRRSGP
jgi:hypothetical protein